MWQDQIYKECFTLPTAGLPGENHPQDCLSQDCRSQMTIFKTSLSIGWSSNAAWAVTVGNSTTNPDIPNPPGTRRLRLYNSIDNGVTWKIDPSFSINQTNVAWPRIVSNPWQHDAPVGSGGDQQNFDPLSIVWISDDNSVFVKVRDVFNVWREEVKVSGYFRPR